MTSRAYEEKVSKPYLLVIFIATLVGFVMMFLGLVGFLEILIQGGSFFWPIVVFVAGALIFAASMAAEIRRHREHVRRGIVHPMEDN